MIIDERHIVKLPGMSIEEILRLYELYIERFNFDADSMRDMIMVSKQIILIKMYFIEKKYCHD